MDTFNKLGIQGMNLGSKTKRYFENNEAERTRLENSQLNPDNFDNRFNRASNVTQIDPD